MKALRSPVKAVFLGAPIMPEAATRSSLIAEMQRANTASATVGAATPKSKALWLVHLPVPF
jgi:hypothetical protein